MALREDCERSIDEFLGDDLALALDCVRLGIVRGDQGAVEKALRLIEAGAKVIRAARAAAALIDAARACEAQ